MSKINRMLEKKIPVIPLESNEELGQYSFSRSLTEQEKADVNYILHPLTLDEYKIKTIAEVNRRAEGKRTQYITEGFGMQEVYKLKQDEIAKYALHPDGEFPFAERRALRLGITVADVITEWGAIKSKLDYMFLLTEDIRESAKDQISAAESEEEINDILNSISWEE